MTNDEVSVDQMRIQTSPAKSKFLAVSDNLIEWTKLEGEITRTIPIPDVKKFYRFALDK